jgi:hypothetical protein
MAGIKVDGPVQIQSDSRHRVAFDLMLQISAHDKDEKNAAYFLKLYKRCLAVVSSIGAATETRRPTTKSLAAPPDATT